MLTGAFVFTVRIILCWDARCGLDPYSLFDRMNLFYFEKKAYAGSAIMRMNELYGSESHVCNANITKPWRLKRPGHFYPRVKYGLMTGISIVWKPAYSMLICWVQLELTKKSFATDLTTFPCSFFNNKIHFLTSNTYCTVTQFDIICFVSHCIAHAALTQNKLRH